MPEGKVWAVQGTINPDKSAKTNKENDASAGQKVVKIKSFGSRPSFRESTREAIPITKEQDRRHIVAWQTMHERLVMAVNGKTVEYAARLLALSKDPTGKVGKYKVPEPTTEDGIYTQGRAYLADQFNAEHNLFAGGSAENQEKGRKFGQAMRKVKAAIESGNREEFENQIVIVEKNWFDPDPSGNKAGFKNMVSMTIRSLRRQFDAAKARGGTK